MARKTEIVHYENTPPSGEPKIFTSLKQPAVFQAIIIHYDKDNLHDFKDKAKYQLKSKLDQNQQKNDVFAKIRSLLENKIQCLSLINKQGKIENIFGNEVVSDPQRKEMLGMSIRLQNSLQKDFDDEFGLIDHVIIDRENLRFFLLPYSSYVIFAITSKHVKPTHIISKIKKIKWEQIL